LITVVGGGLAGSLLALALAERGQAVTLVDGGEGPGATALSYGLLPRGAAGTWRQLQRRHGDLGLRRRWLRLGRWGPPLPALQVEPRRFAAAVAAALRRCGVQQRQQTLQQPGDLEPLQQQGPVVLACGAACRSLAPTLDARLRISWAGILELECRRAQALPGWCRSMAQLPERFARQELERRSPQLADEAWLVDAGLVPCGERLLAGQITLIRPGVERGAPPDPAAMEQRLRAALAQRWPWLAEAPGSYRQAAVSFCSDGVPLVGPVAPGLWVLAGFSGAFAQIPPAAASLADQLAAHWGP
jgi:glycine/D-amino acid oxidase-like deaminating enzyme